jgi:hypothetical protein
VRNMERLGRGPGRDRHGRIGEEAPCRPQAFALKWRHHDEGAGLGLSPISVSFRHAPPRRVLNKILKPRDAVTITVNCMLIPIDL